MDFANVSHWMTGPAKIKRGRHWDGEELRAIRAKNGVGKRHPDADRFGPHVRAWVARCYQVNEMFVRWSAARARRAV